MSRALGKVLADLKRHREAFDLERDNLGRDLLKAATDGVQECIANECDPDGNRWDDLSPGYAEWKAFHYPGHQMAYKEGSMINPREVAGEVVVTSDRATVTYGVTEQARQEAEWFQEGNAHQPPRPFWGFTADSLAEVGRILDARFKQSVG